jgi:GT2 family glycosyltransferase
MMQELPFFSIIIPTYNRPERLAACLASLAKLDYPCDRFEVIVVDDGSKQPLDAVVEPFREQLDITLIAQANAGPATARNTGAAQAKGKFLAFTDDDCTPTPDWLQKLADRFATVPDCMIGGQTFNALPDNLHSTASQLLNDYLYKQYNADPNQAHFFASNNIVLPADAFQAIGGFDTTFPLAAGEDRDFCDRLLHKGYRLIYVPEAQVYHAHKLTLHTFWRQQFNYGRGAFHYHKIRSRRAQEPIKVEPLSFYYNLLTYPVLQKSSQSGILLAALFFVSQVAIVAGFFWERMNQTTKKKELL